MPVEGYNTGKRESNGEPACGLDEALGVHRGNCNGESRRIYRTYEFLTGWGGRRVRLMLRDSQRPN
jgi:hypothetical protein